MTHSRPLALVTGASSGLGAVFARKLAARGYDLVLVARRKERLEALARELPAEVLPADLTVDADLARVEERIAAAPNLEFLVNNAGFGTLGRFHEVSRESQDRMHRLHVLATVRLTHAALPGMRGRGRGNIINVSSVAGFLQNGGNISYCASKAWMNFFTEGLWMELRGTGVRVQALCPGFTYTEFHDAAGMDRGPIPRSLWMEADWVVEESLKDLERGKLFSIPGWRYKLIVAAVGLLPRGLVRAVAMREGAKYRKPKQ